MAVTVHPSTKALASVREAFRGAASDAKALLEGACEPVSQKCREILQSSFATGSSDPAPSSAVSVSVSESAQRYAATDLSRAAVCPSTNGLVNTAVQAYSGHHHLVLRPDDVWVAVLCQLNLYVNANAEALRHVFVEHEGQRALKVSAAGSRYSVHFGALAEQMGHLIQEKVKDAELREWIVPDFSTTTENDVIVASVVMMATLKAYFTYKFSLLCGLPSVTLLGSKADWEKLLLRAEKLPSYGEQAARWHSLLRPVLAAFVRSFEEPDSQQTKDFWQKIAHYSGGGSGPTYLSGWITAFCFFDKEGKPLHSEGAVGQASNWDGTELGSLTMDGVGYHRVDTGSIPPAYAEVDVTLDDNGVQLKTVMVAGLVGMEVSSSGVRAGDHEGKDDTVQPVAGWWLFEEKTGDDQSIVTTGTRLA